jgi:hypothetical protein
MFSENPLQNAEVASSSPLFTNLLFDAVFCVWNLDSQNSRRISAN